MPAEDDPSYASWSAAIRRELAELDAGAAVVGHSIGATILIQTIAERPPERPGCSDRADRSAVRRRGRLAG